MPPLFKSKKAAAVLIVFIIVAVVFLTRYLQIKESETTLRNGIQTSIDMDRNSEEALKIIQTKVNNKVKEAQETGTTGEGLKAVAGAEVNKLFSVHPYYIIDVTNLLATDENSGIRNTFISRIPQSESRQALVNGFKYNIVDQQKDCLASDYSGSIILFKAGTKWFCLNNEEIFKGLELRLPFIVDKSELDRRYVNTKQNGGLPVKWLKEIKEAGPGILGALKVTLGNSNSEIQDLQKVDEKIVRDYINVVRLSGNEDELYDYLRMETFIQIRSLANIQALRDYASLRERSRKTLSSLGLEDFDTLLFNQREKAFEALELYINGDKNGSALIFKSIKSNLFSKLENTHFDDLKKAYEINNELNFLLIYFSHTQSLLDKPRYTKLFKDGVFDFNNPHNEISKDKTNSEVSTKAIALTAIEGCQKSDTKSCIMLCALGIENKQNDWLTIGCGSACDLGDKNSCATAGSTYVLLGDIANGAAYLKRGCELGDDLSCNQLNLLKRK